MKKLWNPRAGFDILDLGFGFFLVKFDNEEDRITVMDGGPWMLFDHYLSIQTWSHDFVASAVKIEKTLIGIRFPSLNMAYYDADVLMALVNGIGVPINIDYNTIQVSCNKFAIVCVEIELNKPWWAKFMLKANGFVLCMRVTYYLC